MTWRAGLGISASQSATVVEGEGGNRTATNSLRSHRRSDHKKAAWWPLCRSVRLGWSSRELGFSRIGFGQAIHFYALALNHLFGLR
jgi:hypothetical protein